jgi:N-acetylglutamate synthase-like GNAT family acetyltransferase
MIADVRLEAAAPADLPLIVECVRRFRLDDEDLAAEQFVVARERGRLVAFGRIKPYGRVWELGSVGVLEAERGRGLGVLVEIAAKIGRVCARLRTGVVAMVLEKAD